MYFLFEFGNRWHLSERLSLTTLLNHCKVQHNLHRPSISLHDTRLSITASAYYNSGARVQALGARMRNALESVGAMQSTVTGVVITSGFTPMP